VANRCPAVENSTLVCFTNLSFAFAAVTRPVDISGVSNDMGGRKSGCLVEYSLGYNFCSSTAAFPTTATFRMVTGNNVTAICRQANHRIPDDDDRNANTYYSSAPAFETAMEFAVGLENGRSVFAGIISYGISRW
jgi:hypothetical protein